MKISKRSEGNFRCGIAQHRYNGRKNLVIKDSRDVKVAVSDQRICEEAKERGYVDENGLTRDAYIEVGIALTRAGTEGPGYVVSALGDAVLEQAFGMMFDYFAA